MKANRKFLEGEEAVSAVIGVILMVAITVAIAATVYVYVSGILTTPTTTPTFKLTTSESQDRLEVTSADSSADWNRLDLYLKDDASRTIYWNLNAEATSAVGTTLLAGGADNKKAVTDTTNAMGVGEYIDFEAEPGDTAGSLTIVIVDVESNQKVGEWTFLEVQEAD